MSSIPDWLEQTVATLLPRAADLGAIGLQPLAGAGNNRVFRAVRGADRFFVKWYFSDPADSRDRLAKEWAFCQFCWKHGVDEVPRPIAVDGTRGIAIYEFLAGASFQDLRIEPVHLHAALDFFCGLNTHRDTVDARSLGDASEACFSFEAHLQCVDRRVQRLKENAAAGSSREDADFLRNELPQAWQRVRQRAAEQASRSTVASDVNLPDRSRVLSPSDFGFHNALLEDSQRVRFVDFEYAGWDDPAKTICDFFCQVAVPVPGGYWPEFAERVAMVGDRDAVGRAEILRPVYQLKWCCIVLNPLLPVGRQRREFSRTLPAAAGEPIQKSVIARARRMLQDIV